MYYEPLSKQDVTNPVNLRLFHVSKIINRHIWLFACAITNEFQVSNCISFKISLQNVTEINRRF
jgi:hypothetical protein